jgi:chemotaxis protein histidine kinase CheA
MNMEAIEEFSAHFNKVDLENQFLNMEGVLARNSEEKVDIVQGIFREIHSLKGTSAILKLEPITVFLHTFEDALGVLSRNIRQINAVKNTTIFDFFLQCLDLLECLITDFKNNPECILKDQEQLFRFYVRMILEARMIIERQDDYFEFTALDENIF